jgi:hypothetical protein
VLSYVAKERLDEQVLLGNGYAQNNRGTVGGGVFYKARAKIMLARTSSSLLDWTNNELAIYPDAA